MEYTVKNAKKTTVLSLSGAVNIYQMQQLKDAFEEVLMKHQETRNLILDLKDVANFHPLALSTLVSFSKNFRGEGGDIKLANVSENIKNILDHSELSKVYEIYDNVHDAKKSFV